MVQAVERAKQVTMAELNAVIGVRGLPGLPPTVCITLLYFALQWLRARQDFLMQNVEINHFLNLCTNEETLRLVGHRGF